MREKSAFPVLDYLTPDKLANHDKGMLLIDYFAAKAMQGYVTRGDVGVEEDMFEKTISEWSYEMANAMLGARERYL